jgi:hypothetical protein
MKKPANEPVKEPSNEPVKGPKKEPVNETKKEANVIDPEYELLNEGKAKLKRIKDTYGRFCPS